jgi:hypothetical protein
MKHRFLLSSLAALTAAMLLPDSTLAGMGAVTFEDVGTYLSLSQLTRERLQSISFFAVCLLLSAGVICCFWNSLKSDFPRLPRLSYFKSLGLVFLWGLLFLLVLTMIAGARELMTPGAWEKKGILYELKSSPTVAVPSEPTGGGDATDYP